MPTTRGQARAIANGEDPTPVSKPKTTKKAAAPKPKATSTSTTTAAAKKRKTAVDDDKDDKPAVATDDATKTTKSAKTTKSDDAKSHKGTKKDDKETTKSAESTNVKTDDANKPDANTATTSAPPTDTTTTKNSEDNNPNRTHLIDSEIDLLIKTATSDADHRRMDPMDIAAEIGFGRFSQEAIEKAFESRGLGRYPETKVTKKEMAQLKKGTHWSQTKRGKEWLADPKNQEVRDGKGNIVQKGKEKPSWAK